MGDPMRVGRVLRLTAVLMIAALASSAAQAKKDMREQEREKWRAYPFRAQLSATEQAAFDACIDKLIDRDVFVPRVHTCNAAEEPLATNRQFKAVVDPKVVTVEAPVFTVKLCDGCRIQVHRFCSEGADNSTTTLFWDDSFTPLVAEALAPHQIKLTFVPAGQWRVQMAKNKEICVAFPEFASE